MLGEDFIVMGDGRLKLSESAEGVWGGGSESDGIRGRLGLGADFRALAAVIGEGERGRRWQSVQPSKKRVTASRGRKAYVSVIWKRTGIAVCLTISHAFVSEGFNVQDLGTERRTAGFTNYPKFQEPPYNFWA